MIVDKSVYAHVASLTQIPLKLSSRRFKESTIMKLSRDQVNMIQVQINKNVFSLGNYKHLYLHKE